MAAAEIAKKTYGRMQNLYDEGVISGQKRDEAFAAYKATEAQVEAAKSQYDMARNGAREQEKRVAASNTEASKSAVDVVKNLLKETVQIAQVEGEVSNVYPKVGELVGLGSPIMSISIMSDMWGTFNVREDHLAGLNKGDEFTAFVPAFGKQVFKGFGGLIGGFQHLLLRFHLWYFQDGKGVAYMHIVAFLDAKFYNSAWQLAGYSVF